MLARARREPDSLVIGVDANADAMAESSRRAAAPERKGGLPNALFVVAAAERLPPELRGIAAEVSILLPWGSLLRGALAFDDACDAAAGIAGLVAPGGRVRAIVSIDPRDRLALGGARTRAGGVRARDAGRPCRERFVMGPTAGRRARPGRLADRARPG